MLSYIDNLASGNKWRRITWHCSCLPQQPLLSAVCQTLDGQVFSPCPFRVCLAYTKDNRHGMASNVFACGSCYRPLAFVALHRGNPWRPAYVFQHILWFSRTDPRQKPVLAFGGFFQYALVNAFLLGGRSIADKLREWGRGNRFGFAFERKQGSISV